MQANMSAGAAMHTPQIQSSNMNNIQRRTPSGALHGGPVSPTGGNMGKSMLEEYAGLAMQTLLAQGAVNSASVAKQAFDIARAMVAEQSKVRGA